MQLNPILREMIGDDLADAVDAARDRLADDTIMARCAEGLWFVEVAGEPVVSGLTYALAVEAVANLEAP